MSLPEGGHAEAASTPFPQRQDQKTGNGSLNAASASAYQQRAERTDGSSHARCHPPPPPHKTHTAPTRRASRPGPPTTEKRPPPTPRRHLHDVILAISQFSPLPLPQLSHGQEKPRKRTRLEARSVGRANRPGRRNLSRGVQYNTQQRAKRGALECSYLGPSRPVKAVPPKEGCGRSRASPLQ